jgi:cytochrome b pre-mRNA-processing protein 3
MMSRWFARLFLPDERLSAQHAYITVMEQSRLPGFYSHLHVPDTLDGRFELVVLHLFLVLNRLGDDQNMRVQRFNRALGEAFFADMDSTLRELGVGDTGVARRIQAMAAAFFGHIKAYGEALADPEALSAALLRNVYGTCVGEPPVASARGLALYVQESVAALAKQDAQDVIRGKMTFPTAPASYANLPETALAVEPA